MFFLGGTMESNPAVVAALKAAAEDSLSRGFAILTCEPHGKLPWAQYSPHAWKSATRTPDIALRPWLDGTEANYAVACGMSNLTVVDCDSGFNSKEDFLAWKKTHNVPDTFTVHTGRAEGYGVHMYFSGAVPTMAFEMGKVVGELRGHGAYVIGANCIHPSGNIYEVINDCSVAPLPEGLMEYASMHAKTKGDFKPKSQGGDLIKAGNRWIHLQSNAGKLRNMGLGEEAIYVALKDFAAKNCEDGENYPDEKIKALAAAAEKVFDAAEIAPVVYFGGDKKVDVNITELPDDAIDGDWLGDLTHTLADGTFIPPCFVRAQIKTILGASLDGFVGFPGQPDLHMKHWTMLVSKNPESGKGQSWKRTGELALLNYLAKTNVKLPKSGWFSSGEHMVKRLVDEEFEGFNTLTYFDEMKMLFDKGAGAGSTLFSKLIELYDRSDSSAGSLTHEGGEFNRISISLTGGFTSSSFDSAVTGKGAGGDGFLSRCVLAYTGDVQHVGDWGELNTKEINGTANKMFARWEQIRNLVNDKRAEQINLKIAAKNAGDEWVEVPEWRFVPKETAEAKAIRLSFQQSLGDKRMEYAKDDRGHFLSRLEAHFKRDLLLRALFSGLHPVQTSLDDITITAEMVSRSIIWAEYELYLREELWPVDKGDKVERMEHLIRTFLKRHHAATKSVLMDACHAHRPGSGGMMAFNMAWSAMLKGDVLVEVGKTSRGTFKYGLND
jgi:hypothetical protein